MTTLRFSRDEGSSRQKLWKVTMVILLDLIPFVMGKWRRLNSTHPAPGIFHSVCIGRITHDSQTIVHVVGNEDILKYLPHQLSLGSPTRAPILRGSREFRTVNFAWESQTAQVLLHPDEVLQSMVGRLAEEHTNNSGTLDVHYMGGITILMHSPCDLEDNFYTALTEEGPMLYRAVQRILRSEDIQAKHTRLSLLLANKCPHHAYRDDLRDMIVGRDHSVFKVQPNSLYCVEKLVTPPHASRELENSLQQYFFSLSQKADEQHNTETDRRQKYQSISRREALRRGHPPSCVDNGGQVIGVCSAQVGLYSYEDAAAAEADQQQLDFRPLKVSIIQRTSAERRIINLDALIGSIQRAIASMLTKTEITSSSQHTAMDKLLRQARVETLFLDNVELWEQIQRVQSVDVLIGVTGSGLSASAFLKPGSIVIELASHTYETDMVESLILQAHGALLRGKVVYRKCYVKPIASAAFDAAHAAVRSDMISTAKFNSFLLRDDGVIRKDFHAIVDTSIIGNVLIEEILHRLRGN